MNDFNKILIGKKKKQSMDVKSFIRQLNELRELMEKNDPKRFEEDERFTTR